MEKCVFFGGFIIVRGYPLFVLLLGGKVFLLIVYIMTTVGFFMTLIRFMCTQCMNFACPLNRVDGEARKRFFGKNPSVAKAWDEAGSQ